MIKLTLGTLGISFASTALVWYNRKTASENISEITGMITFIETKRKTQQTKLYQKFGHDNDYSDMNKILQNYYQESREIESAWHVKEITKQNNYIQQPFYKQILMPPSPNYDELETNVAPIAAKYITLLK